MKQYIYSASESGFKEWPSGTLRLEDIAVTTNPLEADIFTVPGILTSLFPAREDLYRRLPYFEGREDAHVLFDVSDNEQLYDLPCLFIRCNTRRWYFARDPNTISFAWPVKDFGECVELPEGGFKYDISCHAWDSTRARIDAAESCQRVSELKGDIIRRDHFTGYLGTLGHPTYNPVEFDRRFADYKRSLKESRLALCGESIPGVFPYRFWEAMSAGRVPFLISSDYVFPFEDEIPYDSFILKCRADEATNAGPIAYEFLQRTSDEELLEMGKRARHWWLKLLNSDDWPKTMAYAVLKAMGKSKALACG